MRINLEMWDAAADDGRTCLDLSRDNFKALYYLGQAEAGLHDYEGAVTHSQRAYDLCVGADNKSLGKIATFLLMCKKARWEDRERRRQRAMVPLENEIVVLLVRERDAALAEFDAEVQAGAPSSGGDAAADSERSEIRAEWEAKIAQLRDTFERARSDAERRRKVPEWAIDDITFGFMVDPVVVSLSLPSSAPLPPVPNRQTKTGKSYERYAILEHLNRQSTDPLTREPLTPADLRPNLGLKAACTEFLEENGWAADW